MLKDAVSATKADFDQLNSRSFEYQRLKEEADADKRLYEELVTKIREASINAGFENKNTAIVDDARPALRAVFPNTKLNLLLAAVLSPYSESAVYYSSTRWTPRFASRNKSGACSTST